MIPEKCFSLKLLDNVEKNTLTMMIINGTDI